MGSIWIEAKYVQLRVLEKSYKNYFERFEFCIASPIVFVFKMHPQSFENLCHKKILGYFQI